MAKKTARAPGRKYSGALSTPIKVLPTLEAAPSSESSQETFVQLFLDSIGIEDQRLAKFPALFDHYGVRKDADDRWYKLALCLAIDHVRGFQLEERRGRKPNSLGADLALWIHVRLIQIEENHSASRACEIVWARTGKKGAASALRRRFVAANRRFGKTFNFPDKAMLKTILSAALSKSAKRLPSKKS